MGRTALAVLAAVLVAVGLTSGSCSSGTEDPPDIAAAMSQTIDEWQDAVLAQDTGRIVALYSDDAVWHDEALEETLSVATGWSIFSMVQDVVEVETEAASGDTAVVRWTFEGSNWGTTGLSVLTFDDEGTIVAETVYYDCAQSPVPFRCANMGRPGTVGWTNPDAYLRCHGDAREATTAAIEPGIIDLSARADRLSSEDGPVADEQRTAAPPGRGFHRTPRPYRHTCSQSETLHTAGSGRADWESSPVGWLVAPLGRVPSNWSQESTLTLPPVLSRWDNRR